MAKNLIGYIQTDDQRAWSTSRQAQQTISFRAAPLKYGDLSEVDLTVWHRGLVILSIKDEHGNLIGHYRFDPEVDAPSDVVTHNPPLETTTEEGR